MDMATSTKNCVLHQNFIRMFENENFFSGSYHQITNNIFITHWQTGYTFKDLSSGVHQFFIRAMNTFGEWSMLRSAKVEVIEVTGLKDVESIVKISEIYDIQGRRTTDTLPKRIYIIDGHKVICK